MNSAAVALSNRGQNGRDASAEADLGEAIDCGREVKSLIEPTSAEYPGTLLNLASRLTARSALRGDVADYEEAFALLRELQSISPPGSANSSIATIQLGQIAVSKFNSSGSLADLDDALRTLQDGLKAYPPDSELRPQLLSQLAGLYSRRYQKANGKNDLCDALRFSEMALQAVPESHAVKQSYLLEHFRLLRDYSICESSIEELKTAARTAPGHLASMFPDNSQRKSCRRLYGDVLIRKYLLSKDLADIDSAAAHIRDLCYDYNEEVQKSGTSPRVNTANVYRLCGDIRKLSMAPPGQTRDSAVRYLHSQISTSCPGPDFVQGLLDISKELATRVGLYADAARELKAITEEELEESAKQIALREDAEARQRAARWRPAADPYKSMFNERHLAMDPSSNRVIFDMSGLMAGLFGYDPKQPMSQKQWVAEQERVERESVEKAKAAGKHPHPNLCYMCRHIKPLRPVTAAGTGDSGFTWHPESCFWPFGTFKQLELRQHCVICRLVFSLLVMSPEFRLFIRCSPPSTAKSKA